jgi:hypothetical protein
MKGRPNGLPLSCRERWNACQNTTDLVREAVGYSGVLGRAWVWFGGICSLSHFSLLVEALFVRLFLNTLL